MLADNTVYKHIAALPVHSLLQRVTIVTIVSLQSLHSKLSYLDIFIYSLIPVGYSDLTIKVTLFSNAAGVNCVEQSLLPLYQNVCFPVYCFLMLTKTTCPRSQ